MLPMQIGFTALSLGPNTSDSSAKQKWLEVMQKENDKMVRCLPAFLFLRDNLCVKRSCTVQMCDPVLYTCAWIILHWVLDNALGFG